jgi:hypothetical protein
MKTRRSLFTYIYLSHFKLFDWLQTTTLASKDQKYMHVSTTNIHAFILLGAEWKLKNKREKK